jgi:hypothetical protein
LHVGHVDFGDVDTGSWASGGGVMGVTAIALAPTSAAPDISHGRTAVCMMPPFFAALR